MKASQGFSFNYRHSEMNPFDKIYHICMALLPVLYIYNFPVIHFSVGTILLLVFTPHSMIYIFMRNRQYQRINLLIFFIFYLYLIIRGNNDIKNIILMMSAFINICGMVNGSLRGKYFRDIIETFAVISFAVVLVQTLLHYVMHQNISFVFFSLLQNAYKERYSDVVYHTALFRPTGFFLEPSHYSEYCLFALISILFPENENANMKKAIIVAMGIVITTSGMGILFTGVIFCWYLLLNPGNIKVKIKRFFKWGFLLGCMLLLLNFIPFFRSALDRVFSTDDKGYNAVEGRTGHWSEAIRSLHDNAVYIGHGAEKDFGKYLTGLPDTLYHYGIIGLVLQILIFAFMLLRKVNNYVLCSTVVFLGLFCAAHLTGTCLQLFYYSFILVEVVRPKKQLYQDVKTILLNKPVMGRQKL